MGAGHSVLISGGLLVDGTGSSPRRMDVLIRGARISGVCAPGEGDAAHTVDAEDLVVCPGFVDIHTHSEISLLGCPLAESKIRQGVTTELLGNCGGSAAPLLGDAREAVEPWAAQYAVDIDWTSMEEYLLRVANLRTSVNIATLVGADTVRMSVLGADDIEPTDSQLDDMKELVRDSMEAGAFGLSSGLIYAPGCYASTEELTELASAVRPFGGFYASHIRGEGRTVVKAVREAIAIGQGAGVRVQISHHKAVGLRNWGRVSETLRIIEEANSSGVDVAFDVYPYTASCTNLHAILPPWVHDGGKKAILERLADGDARERMKREFLEVDTSWENTVAEDTWENIAVSGLRKPENRAFNHKRVPEIADAMGVDPADAAFDLMLSEGLEVIAVFYEMSEEDVETVISHPLASVGSDGESTAPYGPCSEVAEHPRAYGTFPRAVRRYVYERNLMPLEEMIRKMTSAPAARMGLADRGVISEGMMADVVLFDPERIRDRATFENPHQYSEGVVHVFVNGTMTIENGEHTKERAGMVLRNPKRSC